MQGLKSTPGYKYSAGIAYVGIPQDLDRDKYIKDCYANSYVSIWTEDGGFHNRIPVPPEVLNFIEFPIGLNELGTPVVYLTDEQFKYHYIVARFQKRDTLGDGAEHKFKFKRQLDDAHVEISGSALDRTINVLIDGADKSGVFSVNLFNQNKDCQLKVDVQGDIIVGATGNVTLQQYGMFKVITVDENDNQASFQQSASENKFYNDKIIVNDGTDPMVLGNELKTFFQNFINEVAAIKTITELGLMPIVNKAQVLALKDQLDSILSKQGFLKQ